MDPGVAAGTPSLDGGAADQAGEQRRDRQLLPVVRQIVADHAIPTVLVVEDDAELGELLAASLGEQGLRSELATSGTEAVDAMMRTEFALVVLDLGLPDHDGFAVLETLRAEDRLRQVPLVVYTGRSLTTGDRARLGKAHAQILEKADVPPRAVVNKVAALLGRLNMSPAGPPRR